MEKVTRPELRKVIRAAMREAKIGSVTALVAEAEVTRNTIYNWETGKTSPALDELDRVAIALRVPLSYLVDAWSGRQPETAASPIYWARRLREDAEAISDLLAELDVQAVADSAVAETLSQLPPAEAGDPDQGDEPDARAPKRRRTG